jgi:large subunit ribosomal protein L3
VDVGILAPGDLLTVCGQSKGRGFAGGVKRYHFAGGPKTHGQSDRHRAPGSVGSGTTPGRVLKGKRMAGHLGDDQVTALNLKVLSVDTERNLLLVRGAVPGANGGLVIVEKVGE